jgi:hypothetical protein
MNKPSKRPYAAALRTQNQTVSAMQSVDSIEQLLQ